MKQLLKTLCVSGAVMLTASCNSSSDSNISSDVQNDVSIRSTPPISVQLWSVRADIEKDFEGTVKALAAMGFEGVEFARDYGPYSDDPEGLKQFLAGLNLKPSAVHIGLEGLKGEGAEKNIDFFKRLGVELVIIPADSRAWNADGVEGLVADLNLLTDKLAAEDLTLCYHNHEKEFNAYGESTFWDYIAQNTSESTCLQLDVGWVNYAGKNAIDYVKRYPGRTLATHIKIRTQGSTGVDTIIGQSGYDWTALVEAQMEHGGTQWLVIEQEEHPEGYTFLSAVEASKKGLESYLPNP